MHFYSTLCDYVASQCKLRESLSKLKAKSLTSPFAANLYPKTRLTSQHLNYSNASTRKPKSLVITGIVRSYRKDGFIVIFAMF